MFAFALFLFFCFVLFSFLPAWVLRLDLFLPSLIIIIISFLCIEYLIN